MLDIEKTLREPKLIPYRKGPQNFAVRFWDPEAPKVLEFQIDLGFKLDQLFGYLLQLVRGRLGLHCGPVVLIVPVPFKI